MSRGIADIDPAEARRIFDYDPQSGVLRWKIKPSAKVAAGDVAGSTKKGSPYIRVGWKGRIYAAHRVAWTIYYGRPAVGRLDHKNLAGAENWIENLRESSPSQNNANRRVHRSNKLGLKGVRLNSSGKYQAAIHRNHRQIHLGCFDTKEAAHAAYVQAASDLYGEFARAA